MKLTAKVKLQPTSEQADALRATLQATNAACNWISMQAFSTDTFKQFPLHKLTYYGVRDRFGLSAQMAVRAIAKVADAYKISHSPERTFRPLGGISYDTRILAWKMDRSEVSIWTMSGRQVIPFVCGERDRQLLASQRGETDLCLVDNNFFLFTSCDVDAPEPVDVSDYLGVDLGIVNIATDSDGTVYSGAQVNGLRRRHRKLRQRLQANGSRSAKRLLRKRRRKEQRFAKQINHTISKQLIAMAQCTGRGVALEDLKGIRARVKARKPQRATLHSWSFAQLGAFIQYKASREGVPVVFVDPRNTSRTCPSCGHVDKANRPSQSQFLCQSCGLAGLPDYFAAVTIGRRAAVNQPDAAGCPS